jgi:glutathione S-transferase
VIVYSRWLDDGFDLVKMAFFGGLAPVVRSLAPALARWAVRGQLRAQGIGRHSADEVYAKGGRDLEAVAALLPDSGFLAGEAPGRIDASAYGILTNVVDIDLPSRLRDIGRHHPAIRDYTARMRATAFPELAGGRR